MTKAPKESRRVKGFLPADGVLPQNALLPKSLQTWERLVTHRTT